MQSVTSSDSNLKESLKVVLSKELKSAAKVLSFSQGLDKERFKEARKSLKRVRAILLLMRDSISKERFKEEEKNVRELSKVFREVRNACVIEDVLTKLLQDKSIDSDPKDLKEMKAVLIAHTQKTIHSTLNDSEKLRPALGNIQAAFERIPALEVDDLITESVLQGLRASYRDAFEFFQLCEESNSSSDWISWRRSINFLAIQLDLFTDLRLANLKKWSEEAHLVSDVLGEHQDLLHMEEDAKQIKDLFENKKVLKLLLDLSSEKRKELRKTARKESARLFVKSPKDFIKTLIAGSPVLDKSA